MMFRKWTTESVEAAPWFAELREHIQVELDRLAANTEDRRPALQRELQQHRQRIRGWSLSLSDPDLNPSVRTELQGSLESALAEQAETEARLRQAESESTHERRVVTAAEMADRLNRLAEILMADDPSRANVELALHIEVIKGFQDGRVVVRTSKLGALAGDRDFAVANGITVEGEDAASRSPYPGKPRRLARRRLGGTDRDSDDLKEEADWACNADRFADHGPDWFWEDELSIPDAPDSWAAANAQDVANKRRETSWTLVQLAQHFGVHEQTIRKALKLALEKDPSLAAMPTKMPRARWEDSYYSEVAELRRSGKSIRELCSHFGKSPPLIRAALKLAEGKGETR